MSADSSEASRHLLNRIVLVLWETQDYVNIAGTIRAMKNFGLSNLRLVSPVLWDPWRIEGIAHDTREIVEATRIYDSLPEALADCSFVVAMTARERRAKRAVGRPREIARELLVRSRQPPEDVGAGPEGVGAGAGPLAILFGREDHGLSNAALDLCHRSVTIPTNPNHASLNLAQAVLVIAYELWLASEGEDQPFKEPRRSAPPAEVQLLEQLFTDSERALWSIDFFKSRQTESVMRTIRSLVHRAEPDAREAGFLRAIAIEVVKYVNRSRGDQSHQ
ncbi:tRNA (cytosine(32)/uridine(32)-2'-O)-methyltransferase TrmJ [soil metagenome]